MTNIIQNTYIKQTLIPLLGSCALLGFISTATAGPIENLERERALLVQTILDPELAAGERQQKIQNSQIRLIDLERMILRDKNITTKNSPTIRRAFRNYDLTFLLHAATERNMTITDNWLTQLGVTTQAIMSAKVHKRSGI